MSALAIDARGISKAYKIGKTRQQVLKQGAEMVAYAFDQIDQARAAL